MRRFLVRFLRVERGPPEVPAGEHPEVFRASPRHLTYLLVAWAARFALVSLSLLGAMGGAAAAILEEGKHPALAPVLVGAALAFVVIHGFLSYASIRLDWEMRWYILTDRSLRIREGIVSVREVTLTLANVQELKVTQGPIQRLLDLTDLVVDTAGGGRATTQGDGSVHGHQGVLRGVDRGGDLRTKIEARVKQRRGTGLGDHDEHDEPDAAVDTSLVAALGAVRDEARALRRAVER